MTNNPFEHEVTEEEVAERIAGITKSGSLDDATDYIYQNTNDDFNNGKFRIWQHVMERMSVDELGSSLCRSLLVLTESVVFYFADDDFKKSRNIFFEKAYKLINDTQGEEKAKRLLGGLKHDI